MAYISQDLKKEIVAEVKKILPKGWKVTFKVHNLSTLICTIREMPKADLQALGHEIERKAILRQEIEMKHGKNADYYFNKLIFEDYEADEFEESFYICARSKGTTYSPNIFSPTFATGDFSPLNPTKKRQKEMISKLMAIVNAIAFKNYDNSCVQSDYFEVGYYMMLNFGTYDKPCKLV